MNQKKTAIALMLLFVLVATVPTVSAAVWDNQWFIDAAETGVESTYGLTNVSWSGSVTTGWHYSPPTPGYWHKHVDLDGVYGGTGEVFWSGRVYWDEGIHTMAYSHTEPYDPWSTEPTLNLKTIWKNPQYRLVWDGKQWVDNPNTYSYWEDGRFWVVFPKPS